jgi:Tol biopolymer transport system component
MAACAATPPAPTPTGVTHGSPLPTPSTAEFSPPPTPGQPSVAIEPAAVLLPAVGATHSLAATAHAADGGALTGSTSWTSSDPAVASVDVDGSVHAAAVGTTLVTATVAGITSDPATVTVALPVPGALLITDGQVVDGPTLVDPASEPAPDSPYEVVLHGIASPAPGTIVIGSEGRSIGGRVVSSTADGANVRVRLVSVPPTELFTDFEFADRVDLAAGPFEVDQDLAATYDVAQEGNSFSFTPKSTSSSGAIVTAGWHPPVRPTPVSLGAAQGTRALGPFECEFEAGFPGGASVPLSLSVPPTFSVIAAGSVDAHSTPAGTTLNVHATPTVKLASELEIKAGFEAKLECKLFLVHRKFRVPGWAGLFFGGAVDFGVGFEVGGKVTLVSAKVGGTAEIKPDLAATLDCQGQADCALSGSATATTTLKPTLVVPALNQAQFEPSVNLFGFVSLEAGNADVRQLQFTAVEAKAGAELAGSLTFEAVQIDNRDPETGRSKYELAFKAEVGPGIKLGELLTYLGLAKAVPLKLAFEAPLGSSPTGTASADKPRYLPGDAATVTVKLDPASTVFPAVPAGVGLYNVERVVLLRKTGLLTTEVLAEQAATDGQTAFDLTFTATQPLDANELFAFVVTRVLPFDPPKLELASAGAAGITRIIFGNRNAGLVTVNPDGSGEQPVEPAPASAPAWSPDGSRIAFISGTGLETANADGSNVQALTQVGGVSRPRWSPDGTKIAFFGFLDRIQTVFIIDANGSNLKPLTSGGLQAASPTWSGDGAQLAFFGSDAAGIALWVMNSDGSGPHVIFKPASGGVESPDWSPTAAAIAFQEQSAQGARISIVKADGSGLQPLTPYQGVAGIGDAEPVFSPDGSQIVFLRTSSGGTVNELFVMNADGSDLHQITTGANARSPDW